MQAVILAGGKGTRLAGRLDGRPKPLVDVDGVPLLERQILQLKHFGVDDVLVLVSHRAEQIAEYCRTRNDFGLQHLRLVDDGAPLGTAGAVLAAYDRLQPLFLVVYGDTLFNIDVDRFLASHRRSGADATLFLHPNDHPYDSDLVETDGDTIIAFHPKPHLQTAPRLNLVNAAFYAMEKSSLAAWRDFPSPSDFGRDLFPAMLARSTRLHGYNSFEYIKDLGTPARLDKVTDHLRRGVVARATLAAQQPCVFIDRDGTLNELRGHIRSADQLVLFPGVGGAIRRLNNAEYRVAVVTNQPVIARGECTFEGLRAIHAKLDADLGNEGAYLDRLYFCPHHPHGGYAGEISSLKIVCECRKPKPGLLLQAAMDLNCDIARSWMVGDTLSDIAAGRGAGVRTILVRTGEGASTEAEVEADFVVDDLASAVSIILDNRLEPAPSLRNLALGASA